MRATRSDFWIVLSLLFVFAVGMAVTLDDTPGLTYDEGWALMVAKNWAEGHGYTQSSLNKPVPARMLNIGFPAIAPMALSMRALGVGVWQARLPSLLFTVISLGLLYFLTLRLFDAAVARVALLAFLFLSMGFNPFFWGRLAIGEPAAVCCLLAGFAVFLAGEGRSVAYLLLSGALLALACVAKVQFVPFLTVGLIAPLALLALRKSTHQARVVVYWLASFGLSYAAFFLLQRLLVGDERLTEPGLYSSTAIVWNADVRSAALYGVITHGLPTFLALIFATYWLWGKRSSADVSPAVPLETGSSQILPPLSIREEVAGVALLALSSTWLAWYLSFSVGWARYMYPCVVAASPFVGRLLHSLVAQARAALEERRLQAKAILIPLTASLVIWSGALTAVNLHDSLQSRDDSLVEVARFFAGQPQGQVIESFDMQVFFLLGTRYYHYPPDRVMLLLNRRGFLQENAALDYDVLTADPDYLVVGPASRWLRVYDGIRYDPSQFVPIGRAGSYEVYQRVRPVQARD